MPEINFFWDPLSDNILQERDETGAVTAEYTTEPGLYGNLISQNRQGVESQYHFDALGSTLALTDDNQQVTDTNAYTACGDASEDTGDTENPFQYIGQKGDYLDQGTAEYIVRQRTYSSSIGRWLSLDPAVNGHRQLDEYLTEVEYSVRNPYPPGLAPVRSFDPRRSLRMAAIQSQSYESILAVGRATSLFAEPAIPAANGNGSPVAAPGEVAPCGGGGQPPAERPPPRVVAPPRRRLIPPAAKGWIRIWKCLDRDIVRIDFPGAVPQCSPKDPCKPYGNRYECYRGTAAIFCVWCTCTFKDFLPAKLPAFGDDPCCVPDKDDRFSKDPVCRPKVRITPFGRHLTCGCRPAERFV